MPTTKKDLPDTLKRSPAKAQRTYAETLDSAEEQYDTEARAHQTAWSAVKHSFEKVGDHWEAKDEQRPSDPQSTQSRRRGAQPARRRPTAASTSTGNTKQELYERARKAGVKGRSPMTKGELADALARKQG